MTTPPQPPTHPTGLPYHSHGKAYYLDVSRDREHSLLVLKALASEWRLRILELLNTEQLSVNQIAQKLDIPLSTATMHVKSPMSLTLEALKKYRLRHLRKYISLTRAVSILLMR